MYEFMKTETGWMIYWGPPPREANRDVIRHPDAGHEPNRLDPRPRLFRPDGEDGMRSERDSAA